MSEIVENLGQPQQGNTSLGEVKFFAQGLPDMLEQEDGTWLKSDVIVTNEDDVDDSLVSAFSLLYERGHNNERIYAAVITDSNTVIGLRASNVAIGSSDNLKSFSTSTMNISQARVNLGSGTKSNMFYDSDYFNSGGGTYALVSSYYTGHINTYTYPMTNGSNWGSGTTSLRYNGTTTIRLYSAFGTNDGRMLYLYSRSSSSSSPLDIMKGTFGSLSNSKKVYDTTETSHGFFSKDDDSTILFSQTGLDGVLRSTNHGETWTKLDYHEYFYFIEHVAGTRWIGVNRRSELVVSEDNGESWTRLEINGSNIISSVAKHRARSVLYATKTVGGDTHVFMSEDSVNWRTVAVIEGFSGAFSHINEKTGMAVLIQGGESPNGNIVVGQFGFGIEDVKNGSSIGYVKIKQPK